MFLFHYDSDLGRLTDLAGNLLPSYLADDLACVEKQPPRIRMTSAVVGGSRIYVQFSEPVYRIDYTDPVPTDFSINGITTTIGEVQVVSRSNDGNPLGDPVREIMLILSEPLSATDILEASLSAAEQSGGLAISWIGAATRFSLLLSTARAILAFSFPIPCGHQMVLTLVNSARGAWVL
jgi:hypothetical protein